MRSEENNNQKNDFFWLVLLIGCAFFLIARLLYVYAASAENYPIHSIKVITNNQHISHQDIETILAKYYHFSFFSLPINALKSELQSLHWTEKVQINKIWPNTLKIRLIEHIPIAIWNNTMLTKEGNILIAGSQNEKSQDDLLLPNLNGPPNQHQYVLQIYQKLSKILTMCNLRAAALVMHDNQAIEIMLANGVELRLGKHFSEKRTHSFCKAYPAIFTTALPTSSIQIASADLRYPRGMAIHWYNK